MKFEVKSYKPCERLCGKCKACQEFNRVVKETDLNKSSPHSIHQKQRLERTWK